MHDGSSGPTKSRGGEVKNVFKSDKGQYKRALQKILDEQRFRRLILSMRIDGLMRNGLLDFRFCPSMQDSHLRDSVGIYKFNGCMVSIFGD
jgi:hypothetical protein